MSRLPVETMIKDRAGVEVRYETAPLRFNNAFTLKLELGQVLTPVLGGAADVLFGGDASGKSQLDRELDLSGLPSKLTGIPEKLLELGGPELIARILAETTRYAKNHEGQITKQHLKDESARTDAYSGGNWGELYKAIWWVLQVNYSPFGTGNTPDFGQLLAKLGSSIGLEKIMGSAMSNESQEPDTGE